MEDEAKTTNKSIIKIVGAALGVLFLLLVIALIINLVRLGAENDRKQALIEQNARLEQLIQKNDDLAEYCSSTEFIEEYAREMLDMVYRGETVIGGEEE
ncbi:MAG: septum formation initiator family protein [Clostridiales bacterium]|nr:septum formation initiator family protein [Clostridiales bacterium]